MSAKKCSVFTAGTIWFCAAVSIAEMEAGLQVGGNWPALLLGHVFGGMLLFGAGLIGAKSGKNAMETTEDAFGRHGMRFFAALNLLQLVGWTAVMLAQGSAAVFALSGQSSSMQWITTGLLAVGVLAWTMLGLDSRFRKVWMAGMALLAGLAAYLTWRLGIAGEAGAAAGCARVSFWPAFEVSAAMPLSWLPLISDYTKDAERSVAATFASAATYTAVSIWMYAVGFLLAGCGAETLADGILKSGLGVVGLLVIIVSTITTTCLDVNSSGESVSAMVPRLGKTPVRIAVAALGFGLAVSGIMDRYLGFLYLIASVFAPMAAVLLVERYVVRRSRVWWNLAAWLAGFATYQFAGASPIGPTLTSLIVASAVAFAGKALR